MTRSAPASLTGPRREQLAPSGAELDRRAFRIARLVGRTSSSKNAWSGSSLALRFNAELKRASVFIILFTLISLFAMPVFADSNYSNGHYYDNDRNGYYDNNGNWRYHDRDSNDDDDRNPTCWIDAHPNTVNFYGGQVTLSWDTNDADWAEITDVGVVSANDGSIKINVHAPKTYRMTVHADGRSSECDTFVNVLGQISSGHNYNYPNQYTYYPQNYYTAQVPYVTLSQIPYTGFDFGTFGNAMYWTTLIALAVMMAYLLVYLSGFRALATIPVVNETIRAGKMQAEMMRRAFSARAHVAPTPVVHAEENAPAQEYTLAATRLGNDTMQMIEGETPKIVITRS
ncbi:MAG: hypothetical protein WA021_00640 [Minisyncoccia bacterium]